MRESQRARLQARLDVLEINIRELTEFQDSLHDHAQSLLARLDALDKALAQYADQAPLIG